MPVPAVIRPSSPTIVLRLSAAAAARKAAAPAGAENAVFEYSQKNATTRPILANVVFAVSV